MIPAAKDYRLRKTLLSAGLTLAFGGFVEWFIGWASLLAPWRQVPALPALAAGGLLLATHAFRAMRVHDYFGGAVAGQHGGCMRLVLRHNLLNTLLPMRSGEIAFPVLMQHRFGVPASASLPGLVWFRLLDLHALSLLAMPALALVAPITIVIPGALIWLLVPRIAWSLADSLAARVAQRHERWARLIRTMLAGLPQSHAVFWRTQGWTVAAWGLKLTVFAWLLVQFAPLAPAHAMLAAMGGELTSVLPFHGVAGFGSYEAGVVAFAWPSGIEPRNLVTAAVNLHLFMLCVTLISGGMALLPTGRPQRRGQS